MPALDQWLKYVSEDDKLQLQQSGKSHLKECNEKENYYTSQRFWRFPLWQKIMFYTYNGNTELDQKKTRLCSVAVRLGKKASIRTMTVFWIVKLYWQLSHTACRAPCFLSFWYSLCTCCVLDMVHTEAPETICLLKEPRIYRVTHF